MYKVWQRKIFILSYQQTSLAPHCLVHYVSSDVNGSCLGEGGSPYRQPAEVFSMDSWTRSAPEQKLSRIHPGPRLSPVRGGRGVFSPPGSCGVDLHDVVVGGGQHQDLPCVAVVKRLSGAEGLQPWHGHAFLLLVGTAHRMDAAPAPDARCVPLVVQCLVQQGQTVVLHTAV